MRSTFFKIFSVSFLFLCTTPSFAAKVLSSQIVIDLNRNDNIDSSSVSSDGKVVAFTGANKVLLYRVNSKKQIDTSTVNSLLQDADIKSSFCVSNTQCRFLALAGNGMAFSFVQSVGYNERETLYLYSINTDDTISRIALPDDDFAQINKISFSDDGHVFLVETDKGLFLYRLDFQSKSVSKITTDQYNFKPFEHFSISSNGQYLGMSYAFSSGGNMVTFRFAKIEKSTTTPYGMMNGSTEDAKISDVGISNDGLVLTLIDAATGQSKNKGMIYQFNLYDQTRKIAVPVKQLPNINTNQTTIRNQLSDDGTIAYSVNRGVFEVKNSKATTIPMPTNQNFYVFSKNHKVFVFEDASNENNFNLYTLNTDHTGFVQINSSPIEDDVIVPSLSADGKTFVTLHGQFPGMSQAVIYRIDTTKSASKH